MTGDQVSDYILELCAADVEKRGKLGINAICIHFDDYFNYCRWVRERIVEGKPDKMFDFVEVNTPWGKINIFPQEQYSTTILKIWDALIQDLQPGLNKHQAIRALPRPEDFVISKGPIFDTHPQDGSQSQSPERTPPA